MKPKIESRTLWLHYLTMLGLALTFVIERELLTGEVLAAVVALQSVIGIILRHNTKVPLK